MNMVAAFSIPIDGSIVGLYLIATMVAGIMVRKYVGKVEHFLMAGREMNVYLGIASLAATEFGIVTCMSQAQNGYAYGFAGSTPGICQAVAMMLIGLTGFCIKPLRDSGVTTIPEMFEKRFGPRIRWAAGVVIVLGGLLNMGMFLRMGGDFLVNIVGYSAANADPSAGPAMQFITTHALELTMTVLLLAVAVYTILGGMLSVLVTDFLQFVVMSVGLIAVTVLILVNVGWDKLVTTVDTKYGSGAFNPFANPLLGWSYVLFQILLNTAATLTWQTTIQRLLASKDTRTGRRIFTGTSFFFVCRFLIPGLWGMAALAMLAPSDVGDKTLLAMPKFLATVVPVGLMGLLVAAMLAADMSTDSSYMLTWGSVIYNDILAPFRKNRPPVSEKRGILYNRLIVALIGVFLLIYGLWYEMKGNLWDYLTITGTIYLASMSVLLVACCYWKRANNWGAAAAIVVGAIIPVAFLVLEKNWMVTNAAKKEVSWLSENGITSAIAGLAAFGCAIAAMIVGSLLKPKSASPSAAEPAA
ncbi:MAG: sodium:solute symporter family protein [Planctomycetota bacterium]|nr:sodium:solute symporter family protein [Planctomycetota bacterium]